MSRDALRVVIADDEPLARRGLVELCASNPRLVCVGEAHDGAEAMTLIENLGPDLVLLDIEMPGEDGLAVARRLPVAPRPHVVLVTAYEEHALEAFEAGVADYLVKPVEADRFHRMVERATSTVRPGASPGVLRLAGARKTRVVPVGRITWIQAQDYYAEVHIEGRSYLHRESLNSLSRRLASAGFVRIHRSAVVNLAAIDVVRRSGKERTVVLIDGTELPVSRRRRRALTDALRAGRVRR